MNLVVLSGDRLILRNVSRLATTTGLEVVQTSSLGEVDAAESPTAVVIDLDQEGGLDAVTESKERWPEAMVVGLVKMPGGELWKRAELAGSDLVTTRGSRHQGRTRSAGGLDGGPRRPPDAAVRHR